MWLQIAEIRDDEPHANMERFSEMHRVPPEKDYEKITYLQRIQM